MKHPYLFCLIATLILMGCGTPNAYVLFAQNAKSDDAMVHAINVRLPVERTPVGSKIFCGSKSTYVFAQKTDRLRLNVRDPDGEEREVDLPGDGIPLGQVTYWPEGQAVRCGLEPTSPLGANAYIMWGEFTIFFERMSHNTMRYWIGDGTMVLSYPLNEADRLKLRKHSVPAEIADLLY